MFEVPDPITILVLARLVEDAAIAVATGVSLWSRDPGRRDTALRLVTTIRRRGGGPGR
jgi:hypothetical protein